jgi:hypothetical protein
MFGPSVKRVIGIFLAIGFFYELTHQLAGKTIIVIVLQQALKRMLVERMAVIAHEHR